MNIKELREAITEKTKWNLGDSSDSDKDLDSDEKRDKATDKYKKGLPPVKPEVNGKRFKPGDHVKWNNINTGTEQGVISKEDMKLSSGYYSYTVKGSNGKISQHSSSGLTLIK